MSVSEGLAKDALDVGLFTNQLEPMLRFWQQDLGLAFDHTLAVGGGVRQHRHDFKGSVLKLNHARDALPEDNRQVAPGYQRLVLARAGQAEPEERCDPDGNRILLVPPGTNGVEQWAIETVTGSIEEFLSFYRDGLGLPEVAAASYPCAVRCGRSVIAGCVDTALSTENLTVSQELRAQMRRPGFTYTTIQVERVDSVYQRVLDNGGLAGRPPTTLGETARIAFVRDRRGNWIELSQRASLTGTLSVG